jgi:hypothetical protein
MNQFESEKICRQCPHGGQKSARSKTDALHCEYNGEWCHKVVVCPDTPPRFEPRVWLMAKHMPHKLQTPEELTVKRKAAADRNWMEHNGPGAQLKAIIEKAGYKMPGCHACHAEAALMNQLGDKCLEPINLARIAHGIVSRAKQAGVAGANVPILPRLMVECWIREAVEKWRLAVKDRPKAAATTGSD